MPNSGENTGARERSLMVRVLPSEVTPAPVSLAPVARNAAHPSVVPATIAAPLEKPNRAAVDSEIVPIRVPDGKTLGKRAKSTPHLAIQLGQQRDRGSYPLLSALVSSEKPNSPDNQPAIQSA